MRSRRPWWFSPPRTAVISRERSCLWMAVSPKCSDDGAGFWPDTPRYRGAVHMTRMQLRHTVIALIIAVGNSAAAQAGAPVSATARKIDSLLVRMTLEEKLGQLNLLSFDDRSSPAQLDLVRRGM